MEARTGNLRRVWDEVHLYRDNVRKTKVKLELNLVRKAANNKKGFDKTNLDRYINQKRNIKGGVTSSSPNKQG